MSSQTVNEELAELQLKYDKLRKSSERQIKLLSSENDSLVEQNLSLVSEIERLQAQVDAFSLTCDVSEENRLVIPEDLLTEGDEEAYLPVQEIGSLSSPHEFGNLLSVHVHQFQPNLVATGGVDKLLVIHDWKAKTKIACHQFSAPVLSVKFNPVETMADFLLVACMDSSHYVLRLVKDGPNYSLEIIQSFRDHNRQGFLKILWQSNGRGFMSLSGDKSAIFYTKDNDAGAYTIKKTYYFNGTPEAIVCVPSNAEKSDTFIISAREDCYLHYVDCATFEKTRVNMNIDGIEHVSYTVMDFSLSPSLKYILAATDKNRHFIFEIGSNIILRDFYGHKADAYGQPRVAWHKSEKYILSNSGSDGTIYMWSVASQKNINVIKVHSSLIRDLHYFYSKNSDDDYMFTISYDKSLKILSH